MPVQVEDLNPIVFAIAHQDAIVGQHQHRVGDIERAMLVARLTPRGAQLAHRSEVMHARVAVAVGGKQIAICSRHHFRRRIERSGRAHDRAEVGRVAGIRWTNGAGDRPHQVALGREDAHQVTSDIDAVQQAVNAHGDGMRHGDQPVAERSDEGSVGLEDDDRMVWAARAVTASEEIDTIVRADCHAGYIAEGPPGGHLRPVFHFAERAPACARRGGESGRGRGDGC